ncbi:MAG: HTH domain-containing protein [Rhodocyclaceae bacterium]|nr:HTH domain-containing protein [Rhodocyclaceae bacterium]
MNLEICVAEPFAAMKARSLAHARQIDAGEIVAPLCEVGFETMAQFGAVFTPKRWELVEFLKASGPLTIYALAKRLNRHYRNVHKDVTTLMAWLAIDKDEAVRVFVPWDEIDIRWPLLKQAA